MKQTWLSLPLAATVVLTACAPQAAQQPTRANDVAAAVDQVQQAALLPVGTFTGMVATYDGQAFQPVAGATVQVEGTNQLAITDSTGTYAIHGVAPGQHQVVVTKDGFAKSVSPVNLSPVAGTPRVNMALNKAEYATQAITPFNATVTGVVKDPRGSALPTATVRVVSNAGAGTLQTVTADANGFYSTQLTGAAVNPLSPGQVQVTAWGTTPGGVKVEVSNIAAKPLTSASLVVDPICDAFTQPKNFVFPLGTFTPMGQTATAKIDWLSARADEFYIRLTSGTQTYAVLADSVTPTAANGTTPPNAQITFRVPFTMPLNTFQMAIVPFGVGAASVTSAQSFVVAYDATNLEADVTYTGENFVDVSEPPNVPPNVNAGEFVAGEDAKYSITLRNNNVDVSQDVKLEGTVPAGVTISSAKVTPSVNVGGVLTAQTPITIPGANITQPNGSGAWSITGFSIPAKIAAIRGEAAVEVIFSSPASLAKGTNMQVTGLALKMPSANITKATAPTVLAGKTTRSIDPAQIQIVTASKSIVDIGAPNDGQAAVQFTIRPTGADALGAIRIVDQTLSGEVTPASSATITGNKALPASPNGLGLSTTDKIAISVDQGAETVINVISSSWDLETLCAFVAGIVNAGGTKITCTRDGQNRFQLQRTQQGVAKKVAITTTTTTGMLNALGVVTGEQSGTDGITAEFAGPGASVTQPGGTTWSFGSGASSVHNAGGSLTATFTIVPPASYVGGAGPTSDITVSYRIIKQAGSALSLGGGGAAMGPRLTAVNLLSPFTLTGKDILLPVNANTDKDDAATVGSL